MPSERSPVGKRGVAAGGGGGAAPQRGPWGHFSEECNLVVSTSGWWARLLPALGASSARLG